MSERKYTIPGLDGWTFKVSASYGTYLWSPGGAGIPFVSSMTATDIANSVKGILRQTVLEPDFEAEDAATSAIMNVDWQAMMRPPETLVAPLLNAVSAGQKMIPPEALDKIYKDLETAYYSIKSFDSRTGK